MADATGVVLQAGLLDLGLPILLLLSGTALLVMEALAPGAHFMVVGVALLVAGILGVTLSGVFPFVTGPLALGAIVLIAGAITFYAYREFDIYGGGEKDRTSDASSLNGSTGRVTERIDRDGGEVKLDDGGFNPNYRARPAAGVDAIEEGTEVIVVDPGGGNVVTVTPVEETGMDAIDRELARDSGAPDRDAGREGESDPDRDRERETETEQAGSD